MGKAFTYKELQEMWERPPERQIAIAQTKILEAILKSKGKVQISWSGGKDSTFLLYLYCMVVSGLDEYKSKPIDVVFVDTTNETKGIYEFIKFYPGWLESKFGVKINLKTVRPEKCFIDENGKRKRKPTTMVEVTKEVGVPILSKETAKAISDVRKSMKSNGITYSQIENHLEPTAENRDYLWSLGLNKSSTLALLGWSCKSNKFGKRGLIAKRYRPMLWDDAPEISSECCNKLKKEPIRRIKYNGVQMTGEMAEESELRKQRYLDTGCNGAILPNGTGVSKPLGAMTHQALLYGIKYFNVPISSDYGTIVEENGCFKCSGEQRTGCTLCGFGIMYDWERFIRLQQLEPAKIKYAFTPKSEGGLGYLEVCQYLNKHCKCKIKIPKIHRKEGEQND